MMAELRAVSIVTAKALVSFQGDDLLAF